MARPRLHLSPQELAEYKQLKLCFQCKAKWFKGHICGKPELQVYTVIEGIKVEVVNDYEEEVTEIQEPQESQLMQLSLYTFLEMDSPTTMKVRGKIGNTSLVILIDSGATHNFISPDFAKKAHLTTTTNSRLKTTHMNYGTWVGDLQQCSFTNARSQLCSGFHIIGVKWSRVLGMQWLRKLGKCEIDWELQEWSFVWGKKRVTLQGESDLHLPANAFQSLFSVMDDSMQGVEHWLYTHNANAASCETTPMEVSCVLDKFQHVFSLPDCLPPICGIEHQILLR